MTSLPNYLLSMVTVKKEKTYPRLNLKLNRYRGQNIFYLASTWKHKKNLKIPSNTCVFFLVPRYHEGKFFPAEVLPLPTLKAFFSVLATFVAHLLLPLSQWQSLLPPEHHGMPMNSCMMSVGGQYCPQPSWPFSCFH